MRSHSGGDRRIILTAGTSSQLQKGPVLLLETYPYEY